MTEAMPFLQKAILLSYAPRPFPEGLFMSRAMPFPIPGGRQYGAWKGVLH